jgi:hypothetical protein
MASNKETQSATKTSRAPPPALDPERCGLTQPWKEFVAKGYVTSLKVEFNPMGTNIFVHVNASLQKETETDTTKIALGEAKERIIAAKLWAPKGAKSKTGDKKDGINLPKKSLVKGDFSGTAETLKARALAVAKALGDTTARGRIGSLKLMLEGVDTFEKWWVDAPDSSKSRLLMDAKHHNDLTSDDHSSLARVLVGSPFRGSVPTPSEDGEEEDEEPIPAKGKGQTSRQQKA